VPLIRASTTPVKAGDFIEIYCTGLGATRNLRGLDIVTAVPTVYFGSVATTPSFAGLTPGFQGLYQINVRVPEGLPAGSIPLIVTSGNTSTQNFGNFPISFTGTKHENPLRFLDGRRAAPHIAGRCCLVDKCRRAVEGQ